jgi:hypothetical protein
MHIGCITRVVGWRSDDAAGRTMPGDAYRPHHEEAWLAIDGGVMRQPGFDAAGAHHRKT